MKLDLSWGNSVAVREAFLRNTRGCVYLFESTLMKSDYPPHEGDVELIELTRRVIRRQTGLPFKNIILTNGATGAATIALRAFKERGFSTAFTRQAPYFPLYPAMIRASGLDHKTEGQERSPESLPVALLDSPTNPQGLIMRDSGNVGLPVIWDAVYHNNVYTNGYQPPLACEVVVGSYSKLLGMNGIRVGWIATNDDLLADRIRTLVTGEYCGLSHLDSTVILNLTDNLEKNGWEGFETDARRQLDYNREEWTKLIRFFEGVEVSENGMFYFASMDAACKKLIEKSNVIWTPGSSMGIEDTFARFNLGQSCKTVKAAVKEILKNDRV